MKRLLAGLSLSVLSGVLASAAFPPFDAWPLVLVSFVPMVVAQHRVLPARWSGLAIGLGYGSYFAGQLSPGLSFSGADVGLVFQFIPAYATVLVALLAWRSRAFHERTGYRWLVISGPVAWTAIDALRSLATETFGGTFSNPAYALWAHPSLLQPISVFGIWGLELVILVVNWALAMLVIAAIDTRRVGTAGDGVGPRLEWSATRRAVLAVGAVALAWVVTSVAMLRSPAPTVRVAAVQTGLGTGTAAERAERFRRDIAQTRVAARQGARLVVWNEGGLRFNPRREHTEELRALAAETGAYLVLGYRFDTPRGHRNEVTVLSPGGRFLGTYGKDHPGRFAGDYSDTGGTYPVYDTELGPIATIICYDLDYTDTARKVVRNGARLIAAPSADVKALAEVHYTHLVFRAIENRVATVKADNSFDSAVIDPYGRVLAVTTNPQSAQRTLVADVALGSGDSVYVHLGDWVGWLCTAGAAGFLVVSWRVRRTARAETP